MADSHALRVQAATGAPTPLSPLGWAVLILRVMALVALLIVMLPLHYLWRVIAYGSPFPKYFLRFAARIAGARVTVHGTPLRRDVFFVSNHVSWIDILALAGASGTAFVAKAELRDAPVVGWLANMNRTVYVERENRMGVAGQINALREALADNWSVTVFPEGTTTDGHSLLPFKSSILKVLEPPPPGVLVQPVVVHYGPIADWIGWIGEESGVSNAKRVLGRPGSFALHIHYLEPFRPREDEGRKDIARRARAEIEAKLVEVLGHPLRDFHHDVAPVRYAAPPSNPPV